MKLKASELRVGNIIYDKWDNIERKVNPVDILNQENGDLYEAVELTEDWLVKFGFEMKYNDDRENDVYIKTEKHEYDFIIEPFYSFEDIINPSFMAVEHFGQLEIELKSVHQLQNLYFALTGKEL